jgi:hypothetical protein
LSAVIVAPLSLMGELPKIAALRLAKAISR